MGEVLINYFPKTTRSIISLSNTQEKSDKKKIDIATSIFTAEGFKYTYNLNFYKHL